MFGYHDENYERKQHKIFKENLTALLKKQREEAQIALGFVHPDLAPILIKRTRIESFFIGNREIEKQIAVDSVLFNCPLCLKKHSASFLENHRFSRWECSICESEGTKESIIGVYLDVNVNVDYKKLRLFGHFYPGVIDNASIVKTLLKIEKRHDFQNALINDLNIDKTELLKSRRNLTDFFKLNERLKNVER